MKKPGLIVILALVSAGAWGDFSCPDGTDAVCLNSGDKVCPLSAKCVDADAVCFDEYVCGHEEAYVCESGYDEVQDKNEELVRKFNVLASKHNDLLNVNEGKERCVISAATLEDAKNCLR